MKTRIKNKILSVILCLTMLASFAIYMPLPVFAQKNSKVYTDINASALVNTADAVEDAFNVATVYWKTENGTSEAAGELDIPPYTVYEGSRSLLVKSENYEAGQSISISKKPSVITSLAEYSFIFVNVWVPDNAVGATLTLKFNSRRSTLYSSSVNIGSGSWQTVFFPIDVTQKTAIEKITLSLSIQTGGNVYFLVDVLGGCKNESAPSQARYMLKNIQTKGFIGDLSKDSVLSIQDGEQAPYIEGESVSYFNRENSLVLKLVNRSSATTVSAMYMSEEMTDYYPIGEAELPPGECEAVFNLPVSNISRLKFVFNGADGGKIELLGTNVIPKVKAENDLIEINTVKIERGNKSITVSGKVYDTVLEWQSDVTVCLYKLNFSSLESDISYETKPIATAPLTKKEFSFSVPIDGGMAEMFKKYAVSLKTEDTLEEVSLAKAVSNPESFAQEKAFLPASIKGSGYLSPNYVLDGISQTVYEIQAQELFGSGDSEVSVSVDSKNYYFDKEYVNALDALFAQYDKDGIAVNIVLTLKSPQDLTLKNILCHPKYDGKGTYSAFNTDSEEGIAHLRALTKLLVERYGSDNGVCDNVCSIILGTGVNDSINGYNMSDCGINELVLSYGAALRIIYNTANSICQGFTVSASINSKWHSGDQANQIYSFEGRSFLSALNGQVGDILYAVNCDIAKLPKSYAFKEESPDLSTYASSISASNLSVLKEFLPSSRKILLVSSTKREALDENDLILLSCDYIYSFLRASEKGMDNVIAYVPSTPSHYNDSIRYVGTNVFTQRCSYASELIGKEKFDSLCALSQAEDTLRHYSESETVSVAPSGIKGEIKLYSFKNSTDGFLPSLNCASVEGGITSGGSHDLLRFRLSETQNGSYGGVAVYPENYLDLSIAPFLSFDIRMAGLKSGIDTLNIAVAVYSGESIHMSYGTVYANKTNKIVCDLRSFPHLSSCDKIALYVRGKDGSDIGEPTLLVSQISALSETLKGTDLSDAVFNSGATEEKGGISVNQLITLICVSALCIILIFYRMFLRLRKKPDNN